MTWIQTYSGTVFSLVAPAPESIVTEDIAHHLAHICRFSGATREFYSVAEHSVRVSWAVSAEAAPAALLHDAHEAYYGDRVSPLKAIVKAFHRYDVIGQQAVYRRFGVCATRSVNRAVKEADLRMLETERRQLLNPCVREWQAADGIEPYEVRIECWSPAVAKMMFLKRFNELFTHVPRPTTNGPDYRQRIAPNVEDSICDDFDDLHVQSEGAPTVRDLVVLSLRHGVAFRDLCLALEQRRRLPSGTYRRVLGSGIRIHQLREEIRSAMSMGEVQHAA